MRFDWSSLFLFAGLLNIVFTTCFASFSETQRANKERRFWLIVLNISIAIILFESIIRNSGLIDSFPYLLFISTPIFFFIQPTLLFYQGALRGKTQKYWPHLIIPVINILIMMPTFLMNSQAKLDMFKDANAKDPVWIVAFYFIYFAIYQVLIFKSHYQYSRELESEYSKNTLEWERLSSWVVALSGFALFAIPLILIVQYFSLPLETVTNIRKGTLVGFSMISHVLLFSVLIKSEEQKPITPPEKKKVDEPDLAEKKSELLNFVSQNKPHLNNDLTLNILAQQIGWSRSILSAIINSAFQQNFYDFINALRMEELKARIKDGDHYTYSLDHLVQACGFTNYVSFYRFVKRTQNISPSAYIKQIEAEK